MSVEFTYFDGKEWRKTPNFPDIKYADADGFLAYGGTYTAQCLAQGYARGCFPWPSEWAPGVIPWFCPRERFVVNPLSVHVSHTLRRLARRGDFEVYADRNFEGVILGCAGVKRPGEEGTWITPGIVRGYCELHALGMAHSVESYRDGRLVGGFYGVQVGRIFCGESMFTLESGAAKVAFVSFARVAAANGCRLIDCQCYTDNMARYGAANISRDEFMSLLEAWGSIPMPEGFWQGMRDNGIVWTD